MTTLLRQVVMMMAHTNSFAVQQAPLNLSTLQQGFLTSDALMPLGCRPLQTAPGGHSSCYWN